MRVDSPSDRHLSALPSAPPNVQYRCMENTVSKTTPPATMPAVELRGITKVFPGVVANDSINMTVRPGEIHAVVGENGCGKSTLMNTLYGMYRPDAGTIVMNGREVSFNSPADAIAEGIGMVHQHVMLADNLSVLENIILGSEPTSHWHAHSLHVIDQGTARERIEALSRSYGSPIDPDRRCGDLAVGERQLVEILKVLYRGARILILDEPTSALVPQEVDQLFDNLRQLARSGVTIIFISHKLNEVLALADTISVLRGGRMITTVAADTVDAQTLAELMVGRELPSPATTGRTVKDQLVLRVDAVSVRSPSEPDRWACRDVTFDVHVGEIVGIAGVKGNGQDELIEALMGLQPVASGQVSFGVDGVLQDITPSSTRDRRELGIGYIPGDRQRQGLLMTSPLWENVLLGHDTEDLNVAGPGELFIARQNVRAHAEAVVTEFDVKTPDIDVSAQALSGGNQQKLIVGREMSSHPRLLVAAHPTLGIDVGAQGAVWDQLRSARADGMAVVLISADLDELIGLSDSLLVMYGGRMVATLDPATVTPKVLGSYMTGATPASEPASVPATESDSS